MTKQRRVVRFFLKCSACHKLISVVCEPDENTRILKDLSKVQCEECGEWLLIRVYGGQKPYGGENG
jgi:DNA-directed RNA polymerase subunit RPC12/RpoP